LFFGELGVEPRNFRERRRELLILVLQLAVLLRDGQAASECSGLAAVQHARK
jgi:hypothetical protein